MNNQHIEAIIGAPQLNAIQQCATVICGPHKPKSV